MRLHVISPFHTKNQEKFSNCVFTGKALRFPKMMQKFGYEVIEYSNQGSESTANEHVVIMSDDEYDSFYGSGNSKPIIGSEGHLFFQKKLIEEMSQRLSPDDMVCHIFGESHEEIIDIFPNSFHVETGIGYLNPMKNSFKIYESYSWMHFNLGRSYINEGANYQWVVPNYYDLNEWTPKYEHGKYLAFLGRITSSKGIETILEIAKHSIYPIMIHGEGDFPTINHPNIHNLGFISGKKRSDFLRNARALLVPSVNIEPFGSVVVESMLCGTPVISVDYGGMVETVEDEMGFRCHTLQDWMDSINNIEILDRKYIAETARRKYSLETCGKKYDKIFKQISNLRKGGWYDLT
jgi:glycosyltransferase involved in cell wall biosynthesis